MGQESIKVVFENIAGPFNNKSFLNQFQRAASFLIFIIVLAIGSISCSSGSTDPVGFQSESPTDARGSSLRAELFSASKANENDSPNDVSIAMTKIVNRYIQDGATFSQAESLLRSAGFIVSTHPKVHPVTEWPYSDDIIAILNKPLSTGAISAAKLTIRLRPSSPSDYSIIKSIEVIYSISTP